MIFYFRSVLDCDSHLFISGKECGATSTCLAIFIVSDVTFIIASAFITSTAVFIAGVFIAAAATFAVAAGTIIRVIIATFGGLGG